MTEQKSISEMTNQEFMDFVIKQGLQGWIPLRSYLRLFPEETRSAITSRIKRKHWQRGLHYNTPPGSDMWVNVIAIGNWVAATAIPKPAGLPLWKPTDPDEVKFASKDAPDTLGSLDQGEV